MSIFIRTHHRRTSVTNDEHEIDNEHLHSHPSQRDKRDE